MLNPVRAFAGCLAPLSAFSLPPASLPVAAAAGSISALAPSQAHSALIVRNTLQDPANFQGTMAGFFGPGARSGGPLGLPLGIGSGALAVYLDLPEPARLDRIRFVGRFELLGTTPITAIESGSLTVFLVRDLTPNVSAPTEYDLTFSGYSLSAAVTFQATALNVSSNPISNRPGLGTYAFNLFEGVVPSELAEVPAGSYFLVVSRFLTDSPRAYIASSQFSDISPNLAPGWRVSEGNSPPGGVYGSFFPDLRPPAIEVSFSVIPEPTTSVALMSFAGATMLRRQR